jgi:hypothetical protein
LGEGQVAPHRSNLPKLSGAIAEKKVTPMIESAAHVVDQDAGSSTSPLDAEDRSRDSHIEAKTRRMTKALRTGVMDAVRAVTMLRRVLMRPNIRMMRKARMRRRMLMGMSMGPSAMRDMTTTKKSNMLLFKFAPGGRRGSAMLG